MGVWGDQPWENDSAADFFCDLFSEEFHAKIMAALREEDAEWQWRAAAWVVFVLAHSATVWPGGPDAMTEACEAAADRLEELATESDNDTEGGWGWEPESLRREAAELRARRCRPFGL